MTMGMKRTSLLIIFLATADFVVVFGSTTQVSDIGDFDLEKLVRKLDSVDEKGRSALEEVEEETSHEKSHVRTRRTIKQGDRGVEDTEFNLESLAASLDPRSPKTTQELQQLQYTREFQVSLENENDDKFLLEDLTLVGFREEESTSSSTKTSSGDKNKETMNDIIVPDEHDPFELEKLAFSSKIRKHEINEQHALTEAIFEQKQKLLKEFEESIFAVNDAIDVAVSRLSWRKKEANGNRPGLRGRVSSEDSSLESVVVSQA